MPGRQSEDPTRTAAATEGVTLDTLSRAKGLPISFLEELGWRDSKHAHSPSIAIPYPGVDGNVAFTRQRIRLDAPSHYHQPYGVGLLPYGLARIPRVGDVLIVEGETDAATCWLNRIACLGLPGASLWKEAYARLVQHLRVFVWQEPGEAGITLAARVATTISGVHIIHAPPDAKDPNELWLAVGCDLAAFQDRMESLKAAATTARRAEPSTSAMISHRPRSGRPKPAPAEICQEFARLMALAGVQPRRPNRASEEMLFCPWHGDKKKPNLHVNWESAVFHCFVCGAEGGMVKLRELVGVEALPRPEPRRPQPLNARLASVEERPVDPETERTRLVRAMKVSGHVWPFDRNTDRSTWEDVLECHVAQIKYECANGCRVALPKSCGFPLCPVCMPSRLRADFRRHSDNLPNNVALFRVTLPGNPTDRGEIGAWFRCWRRKNNTTAGFYGVRLRIEQPDVLLVLPADQVPAAIVVDPAVTLVAADVTLDRAIAWYVEMFLQEISSWKTAEEMLTLLAAVKGRRRFQGFGKYYAKKADETAEDEHLFTGESKKLYRASGGSAKGGEKALACPICGSRMRAIGIAPSAEGMVWDSKRGCYWWGTGPPAESGAQHWRDAVEATS